MKNDKRYFLIPNDYFFYGLFKLFQVLNREHAEF